MAWYRTLRRRGSPPLSFAKNASAVLLLVLAVACFTYPNQNIDSTYVALSPAGGRLGNKMFHVVSGYGLARRLNRQLYFLIKHDDEGKKFENYLDRIVEAFPRLVDSNVLGRDSKNSSTGRIRWRELRTMKVDGANWTLVPLAMNKLGQRTCWMYEDPIKYIHHPAQYLQMDTDCGQNRRFFEEYLPEIRQMLSFSPKVHDDAAPILTQLGSDFKDVMCIHTRQNDFKPLRWSADLNGTLYTSMKLASVHSLTKFYIFGDDKEFMQQLAALLVAKNKVAKISDNTEFEDFYVASEICSAFLMSSALSTFGWWLAFFTRNQSTVYYANDKRVVNDDHPNLTEFFLEPWKKATWLSEY